MHAYEYHHVVTFEETNLIGNVYYTRHLSWQGRCRELFLREHAPQTLTELNTGLHLATLRCWCEYYRELVALDEIVVRMRLKELRQHRMTLAFDYWRVTTAGQELVARGEQEVGVMTRQGETLVPVPVPKTLRTALETFSSAGPGC